MVSEIISDTIFFTVHYSIYQQLNLNTALLFINIHTCYSLTNVCKYYNLERISLIPPVF